ncbi:MAG: hypothetical protein M3Z35_16750 [Nitrospirota bacterium]|nr:hypothetical protein [Nitrospirota bacterium]
MALLLRERTFVVLSTVVLVCFCLNGAVGDEQVLNRYGSFMGWTYRTGVTSLDFLVSDRHAKYRVLRKSGATAAYISRGGKQGAVVGFNPSVWALDIHDKRVTLPASAAKEFVSEVTIFSNDLSAVPHTDRGNPPQMPDAEIFTFSPPSGAPFDLWINRETGQPVIAVIDMNPKRVFLTPISFYSNANGMRFITRWQREDKSFVVVSKIALNAKVHDSDVDPLAIEKKGRASKQTLANLDRCIYPR